MAHRPVLHQIMNHARRGLAPMMVFEIAGDGARGMMRAMSDVVNDGPLSGEFGKHPVVQLIEVVFGKVTARDPGLISEEEHEIAGVIQPADCLRCTRDPANPLSRAHIPVVMVDDAIAVEKGGGSWNGTGWIDDGPHVVASRSTRCVLSTTSEAEMSRMQRWSFMVQTVRWQGGPGRTVFACRTVPARPFRGPHR